MKHIILSLVSVLVLSFTGMSQDLTVDYSYQKIERSKDSNREKYTFDIQDSTFKYSYATRGRQGTFTIDSAITLTSEQIATFKKHVKDMALDKNNLHAEAVDSYTALTITGTIVIDNKSYFIRMSCGEEDKSDQRSTAESIFAILKSFIPHE